MTGRSDVLLLLDDTQLEGRAELRRRLAVAREAVADLQGVTWACPGPARRAHLRRIHTEAYLARLESLRGAAPRVFEDRTILPGSLAAIYRAAGAGIAGVEALAQGTSRVAFGLVEPPGHHATPDRGMGFCAINNIAVASAHAIAELGCKRVLIVDWDVHHGNGTQEAVEERDEVFFFDCHQEGLFPGSGAVGEIGVGRGEGYTVNVPLPKGTEGADYAFVFRELLGPLARQFKPDLVAVSAGFDAHRADPLGGMKLDESSFAVLAQIAREIAEREAAGRLLMMLEGGYGIEALRGCVRACVQALLHPGPSPLLPNPSAACRQVVEEIQRAHQGRGPWAEGSRSKARQDQSVLLVDDEAPFVRAVADGFAGLKGRTRLLTASNGRQAEALLAREHVHLVVTDLRMPEMNGVELIDHIRRLRPDLPIIAMSAHAPPDLRRRLASTRAVHWLDKPLDFATLRAKVEEVLAVQRAADAR
jgi:acetoin utilization deacetylase AcuC-like enzyme/ActR/RegA family two-component response regulator